MKMIVISAQFLLLASEYSIVFVHPDFIIIMFRLIGPKFINSFHELD